jgi:hypothetical protein
MLLHPPLLAALLVLLSHASGLADSQQTALFSDCPGVAADYMPECWIAAHARLQVGGDRVFYCEFGSAWSQPAAAPDLQWLTCPAALLLLPTGTPHTSKRWGNALSPYWQARALALLAGHVSAAAAQIRPPRQQQLHVLPCLAG